MDFYGDAFDPHVAPTMERLEQKGFEYVGIAYSAAVFVGADPPNTTFEPINTYTEEQLGLSFAEVRRRGLKLALSVGVETDPRSAETFEEIEAGFRQEHDDRWYLQLANEWELAMMRAARIAEENDVEILVISNQWPFWGTKTEAQKRLLNGLINGTIERMRSVYTGKLTSDYYAADEVFDYYRQLDWVGDKWWWPLTTERDPALVELTAEAEAIVDSRYRPVYEKYGKPIFLSQVAYAAYDGAAGAEQISTEAPEIAEWFPYDDTYPPDFQEQADAYEAVFQAIHDEPIFSGAFTFSYTNWDSYDKSTGIRGKPAEEVWAKWTRIFRNSASEVQELPSQRECVDEPNLKFTSHVTDLEKIDFIQPAAVMSGNWFKNRSYLTIARDEGGYPYEVPVYAPVDSRLTGITFYVQPMLDESGDWVDVEQYDLRFEVSCQVDYGFDHIWRLADDIESLAPLEPVTSTRNAQVPLSFLVKAGSVVGYTTGTIRAHTWDFIVSNEARRNSFANQERYENTGDLSGLLHGDCPYDYYSHPMRSEYLSLFGGFSGSGEGTDCSFSFDEPGTFAGAWFTKEFNGEGPAAYDPGWGVAIGVGADGYATVNGDGISIRVKPGQPTYVDPKAMTSQHCYENTDGSGGQRGAFVYLELLTNTELAVAFGEGRCPLALPSGSRTYYR